MYSKVTLYSSVTLNSRDKLYSIDNLYIRVIYCRAHYTVQLYDVKQSYVYKTVQYYYKVHYKKDILHSSVQSYYAVYYNSVI